MTTVMTDDDAPLPRVDPDDSVDDDDEGGHASLGRQLAALRHWIFDFPQLATYRPAASSRTDPLDDLEVSRKIVKVAQEIWECDDSVDNDEGEGLSSLSSLPPPQSAEEAWSRVDALVRRGGAPPPGAGGGGTDDPLRRVAPLSALLCRAVSRRCVRRDEYIGRMMRLRDEGHFDVQCELVQIIEGAAAEAAVDGGEGDDGDSDSDSDDDKEEKQRGAEEEVGYSIANEEDDGGPAEDTWVAVDSGRDGVVESSRRRGRLPPDDDRFATSERCDRELDELRSANTRLASDRSCAVRRESDAIARLDEAESRHRVESLRIESRALARERGLEEARAAEVHVLRKEVEALQRQKRENDDLREQVSALQDEVDVARSEASKLRPTEERLRKCREKIVLMGDAAEALEREEKAHASTISKCLELENDLAVMRPLRRQLEEYKARADDAEVQHAEARDDLRRWKERTDGLEGTCKNLKRGAAFHRVEAEAMQKQLQEEGENTAGRGGIAVGVGISEHNPELMQEVMTLRNDNARLGEFAARREDDAVQRLEERCEDALRLSAQYKDKFLSTKGALEDTTRLLRDAEAREEKLREDVADWSRKCDDLRAELKGEKLAGQRAAFEAERTLQSELRALQEKARKELKDWKGSAESKLEEERKAHRGRLDRADAEMKETEARLTQQFKDLRDQSSASLRSTRAEAQKKQKDIEDNAKSDIEEVIRKRKDEREALIAKGKGMIRDMKIKTVQEKKEVVAEYEAEKEELQTRINSITKIQTDFERIAKSKITKRDAKLQALDASYRGLTTERDELQDKLRKVEKEKQDLRSDADRMRRQIGSRFGPGSGSNAHQDYELLEVCNALRDENRRLKNSVDNPERLLLLANSPTVLPSTVASTVPNSNDNAGGRGMGGRSGGADGFVLHQLREEYEERIRELQDEKRELVMRNSAAMADVHKAENRSWALDAELAEVHNELTTMTLKAERSERNNHTGFSSVSRMNASASVVGVEVGGRGACATRDRLRDSKENITPAKRLRSGVTSSGRGDGTTASSSTMFKGLGKRDENVPTKNGRKMKSPLIKKPLLPGEKNESLLKLGFSKSEDPGAETKQECTQS